MSHETIYRSLFIQTRGVLKKELMQHLRSGRRLRRAMHTATQGELRGKIGDAVSIRQRPADVEDRAIPGHWEGDLLSGSKNSHIVATPASPRSSRCRTKRPPPSWRHSLGKSASCPPRCGVHSRGIEATR